MADPKSSELGSEPRLEKDKKLEPGCVDLETVPIYCIHLKDDVIREPDMLKELNYFRPNGDYTIFPAIKNEQCSIGLSDSFKAVVSDAVGKDYDHIMVFEDDVKFTSSRSKEYFQNAVNSAPKSWDLITGGSYHCPHMTKAGTYLKKLKRFSSTHCLLLKRTMYRHILDHEPSVSKIRHIDTYLGGLSFKNKINAYMTYPMIAIQYPGYSHNAKRVVDYSRRLEKFELLK